MDKFETTNNLKAKIREAAEHVTRDMLQHVWQDGGISVGIKQGHEWYACGNFLRSKLFEVHFKINY
jgi:hypothetical protein